MILVIVLLFLYIAPMHNNVSPFQQVIIADFFFSHFFFLLPRIVWSHQTDPHQFFFDTNFWQIKFPCPTGDTTDWEQIPRLNDTINHMSDKLAINQAREIVQGYATLVMNINPLLTRYYLDLLWPCYPSVVVIIFINSCNQCKSSKQYLYFQLAQHTVSLFCSMLDWLRA